MAKKRKETQFRPDRDRTGILSKLYLTAKQRMRLLKWGLFGLMLILLLVIQDTMLCQVRVFGATTELVPCAILLICVFQDAETCCLFALIASAVYLFSGSAPGAYVLPYLTFLGLGASVFRQGYLRKGFSATLLCTGLSMLLYELAVFLSGVLLGVTRLDRVFGFLITWGMSLIAIPVMYPIVLFIDRIGGETWKE